MSRIDSEERKKVAQGQELRVDCEKGLPSQIITNLAS